MTEPINTPYIFWMETPSPEEYELAFQYLSIVTSLDKANEITERLMESYEVLFRSAGDILRAIGAIPPHPDNSSVLLLENRIASNKEISPILLVQGRNGGQAHVPYGIDTLWAVNNISRDMKVRCLVTGWESL